MNAKREPVEQAAEILLYDEYPCQEVDPVRVQAILPCRYKESGGKQCERLDEHTDEHAFTKHTPKHERLGNGRSCALVDETDWSATPYTVIGARR